MWADTDKNVMLVLHCVCVVQYGTSHYQSHYQVVSGRQLRLAVTHRFSRSPATSNGLDCVSEWVQCICAWRCPSPMLAFRVP